VLCTFIFIAGEPGDHRRGGHHAHSGFRLRHQGHPTQRAHQELRQPGDLLLLMVGNLWEMKYNRLSTKEKHTYNEFYQVQLVMATATLTKGVRALLDDVSSSASTPGKGFFNIEFADPSNKTPRKLDGSEEKVRMKIVEVDGLHRSLPHVRHTGPSLN